MDDGMLFQKLVGVSFYQAALERCAAGEPVRIIHEPDNPHDPMALRIDSMLGETIGYLPRQSPVHVAILQHGRGVSAVIDSIGLSRSCQIGARLSLALCDDVLVVQSHYPDRPTPEAPAGGYRYWVRPPKGVEQRAA